MNGSVSLDLILVILADVVHDRLGVVGATQVPTKFGYGAHGLASTLAARQPSARVGQLEGRTDDFDRVASAGADSLTVAQDLSEAVAHEVIHSVGLRTEGHRCRSRE